MKPIYRIELFILALAAFTNTCLADSMLRITCAGEDAGAEVYIDGKFKGECQVDIKVPEGMLKLRVQKAVDAEHEPRLFEQDIRMGEGVVKKLEAKLGAAQPNAEGKRREEERRAQMQAELKKQGIDPGSVGVAGQNTFRDCPDCPDMVVVPAGSSDMGSRSLEEGHQDNESPIHRVNIKTFALGKYAVTLAQFASFIDETGYSAGNDCYKFGSGGGKNGNWRDTGFKQAENQPVVCVNWNDAQAYAAWLSKKTGKQYRLPSEAEWEYAARAGTATARYWGNEIGKNNANCSGCGSQWDGKQTAPVGSFKPNAFGLYDMLGNAWQWAADCWHDNYSGAPADGAAWGAAADSCGRVLRGGSWINKPRFVRAASRLRYVSAFRINDNRFRLARTLP